MNIMKYIIILYFAYWGDLSFAESVRSLDLRTYDFEQLGPINLEENWQMRWMDLTHPDQVHRVPWQSIGAAKLWSKTTLKDRKLDGKGYASYRLSIDFPNKPILLAFARPEIATAFTIFLNGKEFWSSGRVGRSAEEAHAGLAIDSKEFYWPGGQMEVLVHVSNFFYRNGGFVEPIRLGLNKQIKEEQFNKISFDLVAFGAIFIMGIYHIVLFFLRRKDSSPLWIGLFCLCLSLRTGLKGEMVLLHFMDFLNEPELYIKGTYLTYYLCPPLFSMFLNSFFPKYSNFKFAYAHISISMVFIVHVLVSTLSSYQDFQMVIHLLSLAAILYSYYVVGLAVRGGEQGSLIFLSGFLIISSTAGNDILSTLALVNTPENISSYGILIFLCTQFFILSQRFSTAFTQAEIQEKKISDLYEKLQIKDEARTRFFNNTSHELRTPLNGIIGYLDLAIKGRFGKTFPAQTKALEKAKILSKGLLQQVNDILDLAESNRSKIDPHYQKISLNETFSEVELLAQVLTDNNHGTSFDLFLSGEEYQLQNYVGDRKALINIVRNLVSNGLKFKDKDRDNKVITKCHLHEDGTLKIEVSDTGIGIPTEYLDRIFEEFTQVDEESHRKYEGTGLGLSIVRIFTECLGGRVSVTSELGQGTVFTITIPPAPVSSEDLGTDEISISSITHHIKSTNDLELPPSQSSEITRKETVLIVDDNNTNVEVLDHYLKSDGYMTRKASNGNEALEDLDRYKSDIILLDMMMPICSGSEFLRRIKDRPDLRNIPIIILTARATAEDMISGLKLGANDYLGKPFSPEEVLLKVANFIELKQLQEAYGKREQLIADEKMLGLGVMAAGIAHEINNPLSIIQGFSERLVKLVDEVDEPYDIDTLKNVSYITHKILKSVNRIGNIVNGMRAYAKDGEKEELKAHNIVDVLNQSISLVLGYASEKDVKVEWAAPHETWNVVCSVTQISQIVVNLVNNAIDAVQYLEKRFVKVNIVEQNGLVLIHVIDSGEGISQEIQKKIFDPFVTTKDYGKGTGLGLSISLGLAKSHGGELYLNNDHPNTCFVLKLPIAIENKEGHIEAS